MNILTTFREIRESRQNIFNSGKVFAIISLLFLFPRQLSQQKSIFLQIFLRNLSEEPKKFRENLAKSHAIKLFTRKWNPSFPCCRQFLLFLLNRRKRQHELIRENVRENFYDNKTKHHFSTNQLGPNTTDYYPFFSSLQKAKVGPEVVVLAFHVWCFYLDTWNIRNSGGRRSTQDKWTAAKCREECRQQHERNKFQKESRF